MTPRIERFLADHRPPSPCLVVDLNRVGENYRAIAEALPAARIHYAVKANPAPRILEMLVSLGSCFDAAGPREIDACLAAGASPGDLSYGNVVKKPGDIAKAFRQGVRLFAFDSAGELEKLAQAAPAAKVYCRVLAPNDGAEWPLSRKFGCSLDMARDLMVRARDLGLDAHGISFHVGSQQTDPHQWEVAIGRAAMVFSDLREAGIEIKMINLGGGFPVPYRDPVPGFDAIAEVIMKAMTANFGNRLPAMAIKPGRKIAAEAGVIESEVVLVSRKSYDDEMRWVYLDVGLFGGLAETMGEAIKYRIVTPRDGASAGPVAIAGPTCDGADILYEDAGYTLPLDLKAGDRVRLPGTGAYTATYASVGFNGFAPLESYYV
ncbi:MAG: type III PLP-dependent enzyme [Rhodospirillales bacterium]|jgi:ornithine decarboxylase|nr:type III PLP-dependent enzyme [Rhodospirillales bacterium]